MLMVASVSFAQIKKVDTSQIKETTEEIGKVELAGKLYIKLTKKDNVYTFTYQDFEFKTLEMFRSFSFEETGSDLESLYTMIQEGMTTPPAEDIMLDLKDNFVYLSFSKNMGAPVVRFSSSEKKPDAKHTGSWNLTRKEVDKLFGKSKKKK